MMRGGGGTNQLHDINWGALNHASRAPQLMSCNYYVCVASSPGPLSQLFNVARKKARGGPGMRRHTVYVII